jgi:2-oxo-3-hexenedioate decarboxylase
MAVTAVNAGRLVEQLASFTVTLSRGGRPAATGGGELVLGSPLNALGHLVKLLASLPDHPAIEAGEIVTTGTLTNAMPAVAGETWSTRFAGLEVPGMVLRLS